MTAEYKKSLTELYVILNYMNDTLVKQLPEKFLEFINKNKNEKYVPNIVADKPIYEQKISKETKILLSILYRNYWCDAETKKYLKEINKQLVQKNITKKVEKEMEQAEKTNINSAVIEEPVADMIEYKHESKIKMFFYSVKEFFSKIFKNKK